MDDKDKKILKLKQQIKTLTEEMKMIMEDDIYHMKVISKLIKINKKEGIENE